MNCNTIIAWSQIVFLQDPCTIAQNKSSRGTNQMWVVTEDAVLRVWFIHIHWYMWRYAVNEVRDGRKQKLMLADRQVEPAKESWISSLPQPTWSHLCNWTFPGIPKSVFLIFWDLKPIHRMTEHSQRQPESLNALLWTWEVLDKVYFEKEYINPDDF